ncbi:MAG TPA: hypothetical protein VFJ82_17255 [Longimicrobium sp.]|nr:hypothetical protein [Longimicrobium sp.]
MTVLGFRYWGPEEKTAWTIPVCYRGIPFRLSHRKFGLRAEAPNAEGETLRILHLLVRRLKSASRIAERLLEPLIREQVEGGHFTVRNQLHLFTERYRFFRSAATAAFESPPPAAVVHSRDAEGRPMAITSQPLKPEKEGFFNTHAMIDCYFSYLEHVFVLLLPFSGFDAASENWADFISSNWTTKYNRILRPDQSPAAHRLYTELEEIKERIRNTFTHGGFEKGYESLFVHLPGIGATPASLSRFSDGIHYRVIPVSQADFDSACVVLDRADAYVEQTHPRAMRILQAGLDAYFDPEGVREYVAALESDAATAEFIERESAAYEQEANMDW